MLPKSHKPIKTIKGYARRILYIKKSKFISTICPVATTGEAEAFLQQIRAEFSDANHTVYCYIIHGNVQTERFSDDGEPAGTAGKPLLQLLQSEGLSNVVLAVTRYFGGILLGTGGLIRAYADAGKQAVAEAGTTQFNPYLKIKLDIYYDRQREVRYLIDKAGGVIDQISYDDKVHLEVLIPLTEQVQFLENLSQMLIPALDTGIIIYR